MIRNRIFIYYIYNSQNSSSQLIINYKEKNSFILEKPGTDPLDQVIEVKLTATLYLVYLYALEKYRHPYSCVGRSVA